MSPGDGDLQDQSPSLRGPEMETPSQEGCSNRKSLFPFRKKDFEGNFGGDTSREEPTAPPLSVPSQTPGAGAVLRGFVEPSASSSAGWMHGMTDLGAVQPQDALRDGVEGPV